MKKHLALAGIVALMAACSHEGKSPSSKGDWGTGLNTVERKYAKTAADTFGAAVSALKAYDLTVDRDRSDEMGGEVVGRRADGRKVTVKVDALDKNSSRATVRVEPGDANLAQMIHEKMADELGMGTAKSALFGRNTLDGYYDVGLQGALDAAERTAKKLGWTVVHKEVKDDVATLDARVEDSTPVSFKAEKVDDKRGKTKVTFVAGRGKTDMSKTLLSRMHDEFDRQTGGNHVH
jgi:hypothetical protein